MKPSREIAMPSVILPARPGSVDAVYTREATPGESCLPIGEFHASVPFGGHPSNPQPHPPKALLRFFLRFSLYYIQVSRPVIKSRTPPKRKQNKTESVRQQRDGWISQKRESEASRIISRWIVKLQSCSAVRLLSPSWRLFYLEILCGTVSVAMAATIHSHALFFLCLCRQRAVARDRSRTTPILERKWLFCGWWWALIYFYILKGSWPNLAYRLIMQIRNAVDGLDGLDFQLFRNRSIEL